MGRRKEDSPDYKYMVSIEDVLHKKIKEGQQISMNEMRTLRDAHFRSLEAVKENRVSDAELASHRDFSNRLSDVISRREKIEFEMRKVIRAVNDSANALTLAMVNEKGKIFKSITKDDIKKLSKLSKKLEEQLNLYSNGSYNENELAKNSCGLLNKYLGKLNQIPMFSLSGYLSQANSPLLSIHKTDKTYRVEPSPDIQTIFLSGLMTTRAVESVPAAPKSTIMVSDLLAIREKMRAKQESRAALSPRDEGKFTTGVWKKRASDIIHESTPKHKIYTADAPIPAEESHYYTWNSSEKKLFYFESSETEGRAIEPSRMKSWEFNKQLDAYFKTARSSDHIDLLPDQLERLMKIGGLEVPQLSNDAQFKK